MLLVSWLLLDVSLSGPEYPKVKPDLPRVLQSLRELGSVQVTFKTSDSDQNATNDYWAADISCFYRYGGKNQEIQMIRRELAQADAAPVAESKEISPALCKRPIPFEGYLFKVIPEYEEEPGKPVKYDDGNRRNVDRFGICCYPARYSSEARYTYMISEGGTTYRKDTQGKPIKVFPYDPRKEGYRNMD